MANQIVASAFVVLLLVSIVLSMPTDTFELPPYPDVGVGEDASGYYIEQNDKFDGPSFPVYFDDLGPDPGNIDMTGVTLKEPSSQYYRSLFPL